MSIRATSGAAVACVAMLVQAPTVGAGVPQEPQHQHQQETAKSTAEMSAACKAMMADHEKMMAGMKAADQRLDGLVATMNAAAGQAKVDATSAVVVEIVTQRKSMREEMMSMHHRMMSHMMEHMQAGPQSMAMCPMMKMGGLEH